MPLHDLLWACPSCATVAALRPRGRHAICIQCNTVLRRADGARIQAARAGQPPITLSAADWIRKLPPLPNSAQGHSTRARLRIAQREQVVRRGREYLGSIERFGPRQSGVLHLSSDALSFQPEQGRPIHWPFDRLTALQPASSSLQIKARGQPVVSLDFPDASLRLWEELIAQALRQHYRNQGKGEILEFQPRIVCGPPSPAPGAQPDKYDVASKSAPALPSVYGDDPSAAQPQATPRAASARLVPPDKREAATGYRSIQRLIAGLWRRIGRLEVHGLENLPATGPFIVVANHQSLLDPLLIQAVCPRPLHTMAKSTQFAAPLVGRVMARYHSFPVKRYQIDPQAVRLALRRLRQGHGVGVYPEGERSWDGQLQPFRTGTLKLLLKAGVPVIPCGIAGSYDAWPRWDRWFQSTPIRIRFGPPLQLPPATNRSARRQLVPIAGAALLNALLALRQ